MSTSTKANFAWLHSVDNEVLSGQRTNIHKHT